MSKRVSILKYIASSLPQRENNESAGTACETAEIIAKPRVEVWGELQSEMDFRFLNNCAENTSARGRKWYNG